MLMMTALRRSDAIQNAMGQASAGGIIILESGMGLGKTRVLEELAVRARTAGMLVLSGRGDVGRAGQVHPHHAVRWLPAMITHDLRTTQALTCSWLAAMTRRHAKATHELTPCPQPSMHVTAGRCCTPGSGCSEMCSPSTKQQRH